MLIRGLDPGLDLLALQRLEPQRYPCLLESAARGGAQARYDLLLSFPQDGLRLDPDGVTRRLDGDVVPGRFLDALDAAFLAQPRADTAGSSLPFGGGWALFLGYELAAQVEPRLHLRDDSLGLPRALALRCPVAVLRDHRAGAVLALAEDGHEAALERLAGDLARVQDAPRVASLPAMPLWEEPPQAFLDGVRRILDYIAAGDVFQVNLSRGWEAQLPAGAGPFDLYAALRLANPAPFAGNFVWDDWAVLSSSPERLLSVRDGVAQTRPIAGTRPRFAGDDDTARMAELVGHPKERAEHVMLIDLERNDLGRVCVPGSVVVDELMTVESYAHVHHIVSNVRGVLRPDATPGQAIRAVFPGGTISGCPKVRCMEIIAEIEREGRGPYTGAFGYLGRNGDLDLNILIRSLWMRGGRLRFRAGAGIVSDSDAVLELAETRAKARGMLRALGVVA